MVGEDKLEQSNTAFIDAIYAILKKFIHFEPGFKDGMAFGVFKIHRCKFCKREFSSEHQKEDG